MTARQSLEELLDLIFGPEDLRRFVDKGLDEPYVKAINKDIRWEQLEPHRRAARVVEALELHGAVNDVFFDRLLTTFPERASEIEAEAPRNPPNPPLLKGGVGCCRWWEFKGVTMLSRCKEIKRYFHSEKSPKFTSPGRPANAFLTGHQAIHRIESGF